MADWLLKRNDNHVQVTFPEDMHWIDEYGWAAVQSDNGYALSGALLVQQGVKLAGRPITLAGDWVWHDKSTLDTLRNWSDVPELQMTLTHYDGRTFNVMMRHDEAVGAEPVLYQTPESANDPYLLTIHLMTV